MRGHHGRRDPALALPPARCGTVALRCSRAPLPWGREDRAGPLRRTQGLHRLGVQPRRGPVPRKAAAALGRGRGDRAAPQRSLGERVPHAEGSADRDDAEGHDSRGARTTASSWPSRRARRFTSRAVPSSTRLGVSSASGRRRSSASDWERTSSRSSGSSVNSPRRGCSHRSGSARSPASRAPWACSPEPTRRRAETSSRRSQRAFREPGSSCARRAYRGAGLPPPSSPRSARLAGHAAVDVVILARGGGSFEDLLPFSNEAVVRAVAACPVPVVSAVGHEQDTPLCDLAADARAATPTAAAALVVPDARELRAGLDRSRIRLELAVRGRLERAAQRQSGLSARLRRAPELLLDRRRASLDHLGARLQGLSPLATLARGYAIVRAGGDALRDAAGVGPGDLLEVELASGTLGARVEEVRP